MQEHKITVDVFGKWYGTPPKYRVYVDNDLLTERDFIWPGHEVFIRENILVNLKPGQHKIRVEQTSIHGKIIARNYVVDGTASSADFITA